MIIPVSPGEQLLFSTVRIVAYISDKETSIGTGFFFNFKIDDKRIAPVLITNKHVLEGASKAILCFHRAVEVEGGKAPGDESFNIEVVDIQKSLIHHPSADVDLTTLPMAGIFSQSEGLGNRIFHIALDESLVWSDEKLKELSAIEEVTMIGYPIGLWDAHNNLPVMRRGVTATHPAVDFDGHSVGLVDIACFPGSSGSPILIVNEGMYATKVGSVVGSRALLLGILFAGPQMTAKGEIEVVDIPTGSHTSVETRVMIHIGYFVKAKELLKIGEIIKARAS